jgi:xylulokinase
VRLLVSPHFRTNAGAAVHALCHALPRRWHQMSVMLSAAALRGPAARSACPRRRRCSIASPASRRLSAPKRRSSSYLSGDRTPHNDADAQGVRSA